MANKYTKTPHPPKEELEQLYHKDFMSQSEIAVKYNTTQKVVWRWFRDLGIKSRKPYKRFQQGSDNDSWKGKDVTYSALHYRVVALRGRPKKCEWCGREDSKVYDWACIGDYYNTDDYVRLCRSCHWKHDKAGNNFPNNNRKPSNRSKCIKRKK
jgi:hypothetical protein